MLDFGPRPPFTALSETAVRLHGAEALPLLHDKPLIAAGSRGFMLKRHISSDHA